MATQRQPSSTPSTEQMQAVLDSDPEFQAALAQGGSAFFSKGGPRVMRDRVQGDIQAAAQQALARAGIQMPDDYVASFTPSLVDSNGPGTAAVHKQSFLEKHPWVLPVATIGGAGLGAVALSAAGAGAAGAGGAAATDAAALGPVAVGGGTTAAAVPASLAATGGGVGSAAAAGGVKAWLMKNGLDMGLGALSLLGNNNTSPRPNAFKGDVAPEKLLGDNVSQVNALREQIAAHQPLQLRTPHPIEPVHVPAGGFQIGGGLAHDFSNALENPENPVKRREPTNNG